MAPFSSACPSRSAHYLTVSQAKALQPSLLCCTALPGFLTLLSIPSATSIRILLCRPHAGAAVIVLPQYWINNRVTLKVQLVFNFLFDEKKNLLKSIRFSSYSRGWSKFCYCACPELPPPRIKQEKTISCRNPFGIHGFLEQGILTAWNVRVNWMWCANMMHRRHWHLHQKHIPREALNTMAAMATSQEIKNWDLAASSEWGNAKTLLPWACLNHYPEEKPKGETSRTGVRTSLQPRSSQWPSKWEQERKSCLPPPDCSTQLWRKGKSK